MALPESKRAKKETVPEVTVTETAPKLTVTMGNSKPVQLTWGQVQERTNMMAGFWRFRESQGLPLVYTDDTARTDGHNDAIREYLMGDCRKFEMMMINASELQREDVAPIADY